MDNLIITSGYTMNVSKVNLINPLKLAIMVVKDNVLNNFFYLNKNNVEDTNIFFNDSIAYSTNEYLLQNQLKQNINLYIELLNKQYITYKDFMLQETEENLDIKTSELSMLTLKLIPFVYNPLEQLNTEEYIAVIPEDMKIKLDYFQYVCHVIENEFKITGYEEFKGLKQGKAICEREYVVKMICNESLIKKELDKINFIVNLQFIKG